MKLKCSHEHYIPQQKEMDFHLRAHNLEIRYTCKYICMYIVREEKTLNKYSKCVVWVAMN